MMLQPYFCQLSCNELISTQGSNKVVWYQHFMKEMKEKDKVKVRQALRKNKFGTQSM